MTNKITIFRADGSSPDKVPYSPYGDKTFVFETYDTNTNKEMYSVLVSHFILNIPLHNLDKPTRTYRRKVNLNSYYHDCITYFVLDIDKVKTSSDAKKILEYFKEYKCIIGESSSFDGISNFNMKGILFVDCIPLEDAKLALSQIHHDLKEFCTIDESAARKASLNAPIGKNKVFIDNEDGKLYTFDKESTQTHISEIKNSYLGENQIFDISDLEDIEADSIEKLCLKVFQKMGFEAMKINDNGSLVFKHPSEVKSIGGYFWFSNSPYIMHHGNSVKTVNIFDSVRKLPLAKELLKKDINYDSEFLKFNTETNVISVNEKYLTLNTKIEDSITEFLDKPLGLFSIRSPMGTGKSTIINHIIEEAHDMDMRVLIITNRISVANDFGKKYGIKVYNKDKYNLGDSLICQYDSLHRYDLKYFDIVIMDEFISLMMHSRNNLNNSSVNISKFFASFNKKLVIADAFLTGYENFLIQTEENIHLLDNSYRDPTILFSYNDFNYFVNSLLYHSEKQKITVSGTSLSFIYGLQKLLQKKGRKVVTLTADTPESTKKLIYDLFEKEDHDYWDVLIFSPSLTVGVSNLNKVPYHFHYDGSRSTDVVSSIQMVKRTRKSKEIHMFIRENVKYIKTSYDDIRDEYMTNIGKNVEHSYLFDTDNYGNPRLSEVGKKSIKIDTFKNILEFNHKEGFLWLMKYHFMKEPRIISDSFQGNVLHKYIKEIKKDKNSILSSCVEQFLELNDIEKMDILMDSDSDKVMKTLAEMDTELKEETPSSSKAKILENTLKDRSFITKCRYYKAAFNYTKGIWDDNDIKLLVSNSVTGKRHDDLHFYNVLLEHGNQKEIFDAYLPKSINKDKRLKFLLDKCGYSVTKKSEAKFVGHREYSVNQQVKNLYGFVR